MFCGAPPPREGWPHDRARIRLAVGLERLPDARVRRVDADPMTRPWLLSWAAIEREEDRARRGVWGRSAGERMRRDRDANLSADAAIEAAWERLRWTTYGPLGEEAAP